MLFPLLLTKRRSALDLAVPFVVAVALTWWNAEWLLWFVMWMCGAIASRAFEAKSVNLSAGLIGAAVCAAGLVLSRLKLGPLIATDIMVTLGLAVAISSRRLMTLGGEGALIRRGAGFSYSLYLIHLPVCLLVGAMFQRWLLWPAQLVQPDARGLAGFAGMVIVALLVALLFGMATEDHTAAVRRWLSRVLLGRAR